MGGMGAPPSATDGKAQARPNTKARQKKTTNEAFMGNLPEKGIARESSLRADHGSAITAPTLQGKHTL